MQMFKKKFRHVWLLAIGIAIIYFVFKPSDDVLTSEGLREWIEVGYARQFCTVVYPNVANCITVEASKCIAFANQELQPCISAIAKDFNSVSDSEERTAIYQSVGKCFEERMRKVLVQQYLIDTPECRAKFL